ncbi:unnamed protein product [Chrysoparadoxa australica]
MLLLLLLTCLVSAAGAASTAECQSVYGAYEAFDGSNWLKSEDNNDWPTEIGSVADDCCSWEGVNCTDDMVTQVDLSGSLLSGTIPDELFSGLPSLTRASDAGKNRSHGVASCGLNSLISKLDILDHYFTPQLWRALQSGTPPLTPDGIRALITLLL